MADYTLNRTGAEIDAIGATVMAISSLDSVPSRTYVDLCSMSLPAGTYVVIGEIYMEASEDFNVVGCISTESATTQISSGGHAQVCVRADMDGVSMSLTRIVTLSAQTTVYLVCRQSSTTAKTTGYAPRNMMRAVRIK